jgi:hypothetical protein
MSNFQSRWLMAVVVVACAAFTAPVLAQLPGGPPWETRIQGRGGSPDAFALPCASAVSKRAPWAPSGAGEPLSCCIGSSN